MGAKGIRPDQGTHVDLNTETQYDASHSSGVFSWIGDGDTRGD